MSVNEWAALAVAVMSLITGFAAAVRWLVKHYLAELKPNSGSSMRDAVNVNTKRLERVEQRIDSIFEILLKKDE